MQRKNKVNFVSVTAMLIFSLFFLNTASSEDQKSHQLLPEELLNLARQKGYAPITDFYKDRHDIEPSYVYGYLPGPKENSAAFWCQKDYKGEKKYFLVLMFKNRNHELCNCPDTIEWQNYPGGLSIYKNANTTLDGFVYMNNPKKTVPKNVRLTHNAIRSYYDGLEELFYCYKGEWLVRMRD
jgi:hypothetical protein